MEKKPQKLSEISVVKLKILDSGDFMNRQMDLIIEFALNKPVQFLTALWAILFAKFQNVLTPYLLATIYIRGNAATKAVKAADKTRDDCILDLWDLHDIAKRKTDAASKTAYENLLLVKKMYKGLQHWKLGAETEGIKGLIYALENEFAASIAVLGLQPHVEALKAAQVEFERVYAFRFNDMKGKRMSPKASNLRPELEEAYRYLINHIETMAYAYPEVPEWVELLNALNMIREEYAAKLASEATKKKNKKSEEEFTENR